MVNSISSGVKQTPGYLIRIVLAILMTIGAFFALAAGDHFFISRGDTLINEILSYLIPFIYLAAIYWLANRYHLFNDSFFECTAVKLKCIKTFVVALLSMVIPLGISLMSNVLPYLSKKPVGHFPITLLQLIIFSLCIGVFEEGVFRVVILRTLFKDGSKKSLWLGYLLSSVLFGLIHLGNLSVAAQRPIAVSSQVIYAALLGMLFAALYIQFKSFIGIALFHALVDFISFYPRLYGQVAGVASKHLADIRIFDGVVTVGVLLPSAILGLVVLFSFIKYYYSEGGNHSCTLKH